MRRWFFALLAVFFLLVLAVMSPSRAEDAALSIIYSLKEMLLVIPPVFVLIGLMDQWVSRQQMIRHMGPASGIRGSALAFFLGSFAAGPLYAAFPVAAVLIRKGCSFFNLMVFIGAWSTTKIPMFLFEFTSLGPGFACLRLAFNIPFILLIAFLMQRSAGKRAIAELYRHGEEN